MNILNNPHKTLVYDIGSRTIQFGFAGDVQPIFSVPSSASKRILEGETDIHFGDFWLKKNYPGLEIIPIISDDGTIANSNNELLLQFLDWSYSDQCLNIDPQEHPILINQPTSLIKSKNKFEDWNLKICTTLFEFSSHPMICLEHDSVLASYLHGAKTSLVIDFGWSGIRVVPIIEGKPYLSAIRLFNSGGFNLCETLDNNFKKINKEIYSPIFPPSFLTNNLKFPITDSQIKYYRKEVLCEIIKNNLNFFNQKPLNEPLIYHLYGNISLEVQEQMSLLNSIIWNSHNIQKPSISDLIDNSINNTPAEIRRLLWTNIILCGGFSNLNGFYENLNHELIKKKPKNYNVEILKPTHSIVSGPFSVWSGGSILGSIDQFPELCIKKSEWEEYGPSILQNKFKLE